MKRIVLAFVFSVAALNGALAAGEECRTVESDLDRLACYDKALGRTPEIKPVVVDAGAWRVDQKTSKMTDQTDIFLSLPSDETIDCGWNNGEKVAMYIRCSESTTALMFITGCHMASNIGDYGNIEYRLDKEKARVIDSEASTDNKALGLWNGGRSIPLIKDMMGKTEMVVRMTPYSESPFTATFQIAGLEKAIEPLRKECGW